MDGQSWDVPSIFSLEADLWFLQAKREAEISKRRNEMGEKMRRMEACAERLERRAGSNFKPADDGEFFLSAWFWSHFFMQIFSDSVPDQIENLYDELEDTSDVGPIFARLDDNGAGWLARCIRERMVKDKEKAGDEIERELEVNSSSPFFDGVPIPLAF